MADIVIRGMEEPPHCSACRMLDGDPDDGFCHAANKWFDDEWFRWYQYPEGDIATDKPLNCPLVPLPAGHGELIDRDALKKRTPMVIDYSAGWFGTDGSIRPVRGYGDWQIDQAPTIVPADATDIDVGSKKEGGTDDV